MLRSGKYSSSIDRDRWDPDLNGPRLAVSMFLGNICLKRLSAQIATEHLAMGKKKRKRSRADASLVEEAEQLRDDTLQYLNSFARQANDDAAALATTLHSPHPTSPGVQRARRPEGPADVRSPGPAAVLQSAGRTLEAASPPSLKPPASAVDSVHATLDSTLDRAVWRFSSPSHSESSLAGELDSAEPIIPATASLRTGESAEKIYRTPRQSADTTELGRRSIAPEQQAMPSSERATGVGPFGGFFAMQSAPAEFRSATFFSVLVKCSKCYTANNV